MLIKQICFLCLFVVEVIAAYKVNGFHVLLTMETNFAYKERNIFPDLFQTVRAVGWEGCRAGGLWSGWAVEWERCDSAMAAIQLFPAPSSSSGGELSTIPPQSRRNLAMLGEV